jgi:hypothetical protein
MAFWIAHCGAGAPDRYTMLTSTSGSSPTVAEKRSFGAPSVLAVHGEERTAYGLDFRERFYLAVG